MPTLFRLLAESGGSADRHSRRELETLIARLARGRERELPQDEEHSDLLEALQPFDPDWTWVREVHAAMSAHPHARTGLRLLRCERGLDDAWTAIAVLDQLQHADVRRGDGVCAGFLAQRDEQGLAVYPRVFRQVCSNGAIAARVIQVDVRAAGAGVGEAVALCLSGETFSSVLKSLRAAAALPVDDQLGLLARSGLDVDPRVVLGAREERDGTVWGLVNALTALARRAPDLRERVRLERQTENILRAAGLETRARALAGVT